MREISQQAILAGLAAGDYYKWHLLNMMCASSCSEVVTHFSLHASWKGIDMGQSVVFELIKNFILELWFCCVLLLFIEMQNKLFVDMPDSFLTIQQ